MLIKFKRTNEKAVLPSFAKPGDAGLDLTCTEVIKEDEFSITYGTGIAMELPKDHVGYIFPRSSIRKYDLALSNSVGVIDSGYRGEIAFTFKKLLGTESKIYEVGDRVGQLVVMQLPKVVILEVDELSNSERGTGGFGSTGK